MFNDIAKVTPSIEGHVRVWEEETGKVLLDRHNAVHPENLSLAIVNALAGKSAGHIASLRFGNGGAQATSSNRFIYSTPRTSGAGAELYNQIYPKALSSSDFTIGHASDTVYSDLTIDCILAANEPANAPDTTASETGLTTDFTFSEIGLFVNDGTMITHVCHYPISKAQNITLHITYLLRIQVA